MTIEANFEDENVNEVLKRDDVQQAIKDKIEEEKSGLLNKRNELLGQITSLKGELNKYKELGDPEELQTKMQKLEETNDQSSEKDSELENLKTQMQNQLEQERSKTELMKNKIVEKEKSQNIERAIREEKGIPELLKPVIEDRIDATMHDDGSVELKVKDPNGNPKFVEDGKEAGIKDVVRELKNNEKYMRAFESSGITGTGTKASTSIPNTEENPAKTGNLTKLASVYNEDPQRAKQLMDEAGWDKRRMDKFFNK